MRAAIGGRTRTSVSTGNMLAVKSGAQSAAIVNEHVPSVVTALVENMAELPFLDLKVDEPLLHGLARKLVQRSLIYAYLDKLDGGVGSLIDNRGRKRGCVGLLGSLDNSIREDCKLLGIGPSARALLMSSVSTIQRDQQAKQAQSSLRREYGS